MSEALLVLGGSIFFAMGSLHGILTLRDVARPQAFTPTDDTVREVMQGARVAFNPRINLWKAWLGFNLSHSLGVTLFGAMAFAMGLFRFELFAGNPVVQVALVSIAAAYLVLSLAFWFSGPAIGSAASLLCFLGAIMFQ